METQTGKESIVSRLFGFGKKKREGPKGPPPSPEESGFARAGEASGEAEEPGITVPEQVIRIRTHSVQRRDDAVQAIGESFRELTSMLSSVNDRLDRQDARTGDLAGQLSELPEYLRSLPQLHEQHNEALRGMAQSLSQLPEARRDQVRAVEGMAQAIDRIPDTLRENTAAQEQAIRKVAAAQQQAAKVIHVGQQRSIQAFHQATRKALRQQQRHMESVIGQSQRMFKTTVVFMAVTLAAVVALLLLR